ncbi:hypothetical protein [Pseudomonas fulva]|uniref:hypothetical protein n=1 Tax=Pseudomonas fulva TaxID=47880 RepID=UPI0009E05B57|nr:hypothetical protein [Pseudomonas fulva]
MSQLQAQLDAIEHLLMAVLRTSGSSIPSTVVFRNAESSLAGADGPPGTDEKTAARNYLDHLKKQL